MLNGNCSNRKAGGRVLTGLREECGIFGIAGTDSSKNKPAYETFVGLFSLQHRGQEAAGIAINNKGVISCRKGPGLLTNVFDEEDIESMKGTSAIGHVRYSTTGDKDAVNAQPICVSHIKGNLAIAHNGNLTNAYELREKFELEGGIFHTTSDSEIIVHEIVRHRLKTGKIEEAVKNAMLDLRGAFSLIVMSPKKVIAARDPYGFRPLVMGKLGDDYVFASETCAIDVIGADYIRDVLPGEIITVENGELKSEIIKKDERDAFCVFEYIYLSRPDSFFYGYSMDEARADLGRELAKNFTLPADIVLPVPDSGIPAARGFAEGSGIPLGTGLIKNRYIARTFIAPTQKKRENQIRLKLNPLKSNIEGKRVVLVDDSIVRGTTSKRLVDMIRNAGAKEVHFCSTAPPFKFPCFFGIDVPDTNKLIANNNSIEEMRKILGLNSLHFLKLEDLRKVYEKKKIGICDGCFSNEYPLPAPKVIKKNKFDKPLR